MNFTPELSAFQGAIISAQNVHPFSKVTARGGHEEEILNIISRLFAFLHEKQYITKDGVAEGSRTIMRKLSFYIFMNGDFAILEDLVELPGLDIAIWTIPIIPKCLVCEIIWGLQMEEFLYETIAMSYPTLVIEVLPPFVENLKHYSPADAPSKLKVLATACYKFVSRLNFFTYEDSFIALNLAGVYENFLRIITYFVIPPNESRLNNLSEDESYKYKGNNLRTLLIVILECLRTYTTVEIYDPEGFQDIYMWTIKPENIKTTSITYRVCDSPEEKLMECLAKLNTALLDKCKSLVMDVSVDTFCAWSEYDEGGKSMQQRVGELCHMLHSTLGKIDTLAEHPIIEMLPQISCKPKDINDLISLADEDTIIENIYNDSENRSLWLKVALEREEFLHQKEFVECLLKNVQHIYEEKYNDLLKKIITYVKENDCPEHPIIQLGLYLFRKCDVPQKHEMISELFTEKTFVNYFETSDLDSMITETFNKLIAAPDDDLSDILNIFIQNPYKTYSKIISCATENIDECDIMLRIINLIDPYSSHFYRTDTEPCVIKLIQDFSHEILYNDRQKSNFVYFIKKLKEVGIIPGVKLLLLHIMPNMNRALAARNVAMISIQLQLLKRCFTMGELVMYRPPLLVMLAKVMQVVRWNIMTYTSGKADTLERAIQLQINFFDTFGSNIPNKELQWLKRKLSLLAPLNMYYYRGLWEPPGRNYIEIVLSRTDVTTNNKLLFLLTKIMPKILPREWTSIWESLSEAGPEAALGTLCEAMILLASVEERSRGGRSWPCLIYCYRNLFVIIVDKFFSEPLQDGQLKWVLEYLVAVINMSSAEDLADLTPTLLSFLSYIFERNADFTYDLTHFINRLGHENFKELLTQMLSSYQ